jgi:hypothetical protein
MTNIDVPHFINTQTQRFQHVLKLSSPRCAIICAPSYEELEKTVDNVLEGHMLRKNPRKQMTSRDIPHFFYTQTAT